MLRQAEKAYFDKEFNARETIKRLTSIAAEQRKPLFLLFIILVLNMSLSISLPLLVRNGINELTRDNPDFEMIRLIAWFFFLGSLLQWIVTYYQTRTQWIVIAKSISSLRVKMFDKLQNLDVGFYDKMQTGRVMNRVMDDSNQAGSLINIFASFVSSVSFIVIVLSIMFSLNISLAVGILLILPLLILIVLSVAKYIRRFAQRVRRTRAAVNSAVQELVTGVSIAKGFNRQERNRDEFLELNQDNLKASLNLSYTFSIFFPLIDFISVLVLFVILVVGGGQVIDQSIAIGDLYLFYAYTLLLLGPIIVISQQIAQIQAGSAATERIFSLIDLESEIKVGNLKLNKMKGKIEFKDVSFEYVPGEPVYENLNIVIEPGQTIALVGHTGAGKTTIVSLLARFYEIQSGEILIDDINLQSIDIESYRSHIGIVLQEPYLFSGTIEDNIKYGSSQATEEVIQNAIQLTYLHEFIDTLPEGLQTDVRERGSRLSTGQRQLVTLARALVADPTILILDEATASVDAYTESMIQQGLQNLFSGRTSIVVAHRLSTIINAERILVFDDGKIIGDGSHDELIKTNSKYFELYKTYYEFQGVKENVV
jgi:ATP-binding cassette, subfamily B, bacterial